MSFALSAERVWATWTVNIQSGWQLLAGYGMMQQVVLTMNPIMDYLIQ